jgi:GT2 family glycosyltransferase
MNRMTVSVVIPTWNRRDLLLRVLGALANQTRRPEEVIVVDNASTDQTGEAAREAGARVIRMTHNAGFAAAVNAGVVESSGGLVAVLNNDVNLAADWLALLREAAVRDGVWFATGKILSARQPELLDGTFDLMARSGFAWRAGHGRASGGVWNQPRTIHMASMTATLFRRELFEKVGLLDEQYGSYYEDVDFGLRCAAAGWRGRYVPEAIAWHEASATLGAWSPAMVEKLTRNQQLLVRKHFPPGMSRPVLVGQVLWALLALRRGCSGAWWRGWRAGRAEPVTRGGGHLRLTEVLEDSERELLLLQRESGGDAYWRWYQRLSG